MLKPSAKLGSDQPGEMKFHSAMKGDERKSPRGGHDDACSNSENLATDLGSQKHEEDAFFRSHEGTHCKCGARREARATPCGVLVEEEVLPDCCLSTSHQIRNGELRHSEDQISEVMVEER